MKALHRLHVIELSPAIIGAVHGLLARHVLRAGDAVQLASALALREGLGGATVDIVVYDARVHAAALEEGFAVRPAKLKTCR